MIICVMELSLTDQNIQSCFQQRGTNASVECICDVFDLTQILHKNIEKCKILLCSDSEENPYTVFAKKCMEPSDTPDPKSDCPDRKSDCTDPKSNCPDPKSDCPDPKSDCPDPKP